MIHSASSVDIVICDLNMPEMDGMEFLRHLGQEDGHIAIIITSALDSKLLNSVGRMSKLFGIRVLGVMEKPVTLVNLRHLLMKYEIPKSEHILPEAKYDFSLEEILNGIHDDQFEPFFQPKVGVNSGRLTGAEALVRWIHPEHGVIPPNAFIPLLERSGNIDELTFIMLEKSAAACKQFHGRGHMLCISVNLSMTSLNDPALADQIARVVRKAGIEPQYIVLEITESAAMTDAAHALENLARLCMNGFSLSIDDYGTGYSSLQQLTRIAFSELKIDQSFVKDAAENKSQAIVVESSIDMAHKLQVRSVAEGVESQQDWDMLRNAGCDLAQGYFIAKPMNMSSFHDFMENFSFSNLALKKQPANDSGKKSVLVIDDDDFTRNTVLRVLGNLGYSHTKSAADTKSALKLLEDNEFDLIITDVHMPGMNGLEFVRQIRTGKTHAKPDTRIVVLTSFSQTDVLGTALALDINGFLVKPIIPAVADVKLTQAMSEKLKLHPPIAYEAVRTEMNSLLHDGRPQSRFNDKAPTFSKKPVISDGNVLRHSIRSLRPGMMLEEDVFLTDGTLLMSSGQIFSEHSINRLNDLRELLPCKNIAAQ